MNSSWDDSIKFVLEQEGGYTNDPNDAGGETNFGICKRDFPDLDIRNLTQAAAEQIYITQYWQECQCDGLPWPLDICVFDTAVNEGTRPAKRILQGALSVNVDGIIGDATIAAAFKADPATIAKRYLMHRLTAYTRIILAKPNDIVFANTWHKRVLDLFQLVMR